MTRRIHKINAGKDGKLAPDWFRPEERTGWVSIGYSVGDPKGLTPEEIRRRDDSPNQQTSRFLGVHEKDELNLRECDEVIAYVPKYKILLGVGTVTGDPQYREDPDVTLDDPHPHWRKVRWHDWSRPVRLSDLPEALKTGKNRVYPRMSIERYNGDYDRLKRVLQTKDPLDFDSITWRLAPKHT